METIKTHLQLLQQLHSGGLSHIRQLQCLGTFLRSCLACGAGLEQLVVEDRLGREHAHVLRRHCGTLGCAGAGRLQL